LQSSSAYCLLTAWVDVKVGRFPQEKFEAKVEILIQVKFCDEVQFAGEQFEVEQVTKLGIFEEQEYFT